jgi:tetratricopeptide (TPR) repeat protein
MSMTIRKSWKVIVVAGIALCLIVAWVFKPAFISNEDLFEAVHEAFRQKNFRLAEQLCQRLLFRNPDWREVLTLAASAAEKGGHLEIALHYLDSIPDDETPQAAETSFRRGELAIGLGNLTVAESNFRRTTAIDSSHVEALRRLCCELKVGTGRLNVICFNSPG